MTTSRLPAVVALGLILFIHTSSLSAQNPFEGFWESTSGRYLHIDGNGFAREGNSDKGKIPTGEKKPVIDIDKRRYFGIFTPPELAPTTPEQWYAGSWMIGNSGTGKFGVRWPKVDVTDVIEVELIQRNDAGLTLNQSHSGVEVVTYTRTKPFPVDAGFGATGTFSTAAFVPRRIYGVWKIDRILSTTSKSLCKTLNDKWVDRELAIGDPGFAPICFIRQAPMAVGPASKGTAIISYGSIDSEDITFSGPVWYDMQNREAGRMQAWYDAENDELRGYVVVETPNAPGVPDIHFVAKRK